MKKAQYTLCAITCIALCGCSPFYAIIAQIYQNQPAVNIDHYPAATHTHIKKTKLGKLDFSSYKSPHERSKTPSDISIAIATSGGGYRATNLTTGVMMGLDQTPSIKKNKSLLEDIDYFSSVSGSGLAIGYYLSLYLDHLQHPRNSFSYSDHIRLLLNKDRRLGIANILRRNLDPYLFTGKPTGTKIFEEKISQLFNVHKHNLVLGDVFIANNSPKPQKLPYWLPNSTIFQNMLSFPFYPYNLNQYRIIGYYNRTELVRYRKGESKATFYNKVPFSLAASASACYPIALSPITLLSTACTPNCYLHLVDGGIADNLGVMTALKALIQDPGKIKILIILNASSSKDSPFSKDKAPPRFFNILAKLPDMVTEGQTEQIKSSLTNISEDMLCRNNTTNTIVLMYSLAKYQSARNINTSFSSSLAEQKKLIRIGQQMIQNSKQLHELISEIKNGRVTMGKCSDPVPSILEKEKSKHDLFPKKLFN